MKYLLIDTATDNCSVGIAEAETLLSRVEAVGKHQHSEVLNVYIQEALSQANTALSEIAGVAVAKGPGSYTGLRIGVSTAKALSYALVIPVVGLNTLAILAQQGVSQTLESAALYRPMLDARRMEVYTALYDGQIQQKSDASATVMDEEVARAYADGHEQLYVLGEGAKKVRDYFTGMSNVNFLDIPYPSVTGIAPLAAALFQNNQTEHAASFEPFYLKPVAASANEKLKKFLNP